LGAAKGLFCAKINDCARNCAQNVFPAANTLTAGSHFAKSPLQSGKNWECHYQGAALSASWIMQI